LQADKDNELAEKYRQDLRIKSASIEQLCGKLSGGNQQKVILAKWLATKPTILLLDEPTRGIDIQAKDEIYQLMKQIAAEGTCILFASSEIPEIVALADRVLVMCQGQIQAELTGSHLNASNLLKEALPIL
jgi:ribose transport system ATP-binding protein